MNLNSRTCIYNLGGKLSVTGINFLICKKKRQTDRIFHVVFLSVLALLLLAKHLPSESF